MSLKFKTQNKLCAPEVQILKYTWNPWNAWNIQNCTHHARVLLLCQIVKFFFKRTMHVRYGTASFFVHIGLVLFTVQLILENSLVYPLIVYFSCILSFIEFQAVSRVNTAVFFFFCKSAYLLCKIRKVHILQAGKYTKSITFLNTLVKKKLFKWI